MQKLKVGLNFFTRFWEHISEKRLDGTSLPYLGR
jgi:hypothetical protein